MGSQKSLEDLEKGIRTDVSLETSIKNFGEIVRNDKDLDEKYLTLGLQYSLKQLSRYVDTIGDLKKLAENVDGFSRLKSGIRYNNGRWIPRSALKGFGKKKFNHLNTVLAKYGIEQIPWISKKYVAWERQLKKGWDWYKNIQI